MQQEVTYKVSADDLKQAINESLQENIEAKVYNRFYNTLIDCKTVCKIHNLSQNTVTNYIKDGILTPEPGTKQFRLSAILKLDLSSVYRKRK